MTHTQDRDNQVPGGVYLCQVDKNISCGACCGLYNVADPSREALAKLLVRRTLLFETVPRNVDAIDDFGRQMAAEVKGNRPFPDFYHCPYIGMIGLNRSRVGCLLHPLADGNNGADFRGLSHYGGMACSLYFCPSFSKVPKLLKNLIRRAAIDWYHYGLIITETDLLCSVADHIQSGIDGAFDCSPRPDSETNLEFVRKLIDQKLTWPFQPNPATDRVNYFFKDRLYAKPPVYYGEFNTAVSPYDEIFRNLVSVFHTADHLRRAETMIHEIIKQMAGLMGSPVSFDR